MQIDKFVNPEPVFHHVVRNYLTNPERGWLED